MTWEKLLTFHFGEPWWLLLLLLLPYWAYRIGREGPSAALRYSSTALLAALSHLRRVSPGRLLMTARLLAVALLIVAMARPRTEQGESPDRSEGIDVMMVVDISASMDTRDFVAGAERLTRREALVKAISHFVDARPRDRLGMVGFAKDVYLLSPLTIDGEWIKNVLMDVELKGGTAIGDGLIAGVDLIKEGKGKSQVVILVTDGLNNNGENPLTAGEYAKANHVRVYALEILNLRRIQAASAVKSPLSQIATATGGQYFQASDTEALLNIYRQIDQMEKHRIEQARYRIYDEQFWWFAVPAFILVAFEWVASHTFWMRLP
jgi:Ca-activated chloride channel family protein